MMAASGSGDVHAREIAAGLVAAVRGAIAAGSAAPGAAAPTPARALAWTGAANVADLLELPGLAALLGACANAAPGPAVERALERMTRLADEAEARGDMRAFARADHELAELAISPELVEAASGTQAGPAAPRAVPAPAPGPASGKLETHGDSDDVRSLEVLLADFSFDDPAAVAKAMVAMPVAAGLRAALDWIAADAGGRLHVEVQDAALTLVARAANEVGLGAAGAVLGLTGGALLPEPDGRWAMRVPLHSARPAFLLARQGELSLALPWHAVAKLKITDETSRATMTEPSLQPWSPLARVRGERPAALIALGLSRAWLHLDHIVWRVFARPEPADGVTVVPGGTQVVRTEEGEAFRVVDVEVALAGVTPVHTPELPASRLPDIPATPSFRMPASIAVEPAVEPAKPPAPAPIVLSPEPPAVTHPPEVVAVSLPVQTPLAEPRVLGPEFVRALGAPIAVATAPPVAAPVPAVTLPPAAVKKLEASPEPVAKPSVRRALVVDDSLVARMELGRVLERRGWEVEWVETAAEMWSILPANEWSIVFVDVSLPDARGRAHLKTLAAQQRIARHRFELVALTRDEADERLVLDAGIVRMLRKPFAPGSVERTVRELQAAGA